MTNKGEIYQENAEELQKYFNNTLEEIFNVSISAVEVDEFAGLGVFKLTHAQGDYDEVIYSVKKVDDTTKIALCKRFGTICSKMCIGLLNQAMD